MIRLAGTTLLLSSLLLVPPSPGAAQSLDYGALEQVFHEPVTTSATGMPQRVSEAPVNMEIVTQEDIRRSGATNIPDVLQFVTGIDIRHYGIADAELGIRGYNQPYNPRLLVLVDGRQVYSDDYGHVSWSAIPVQLAEIRQIEVIKGPNSALYGFNAVSGVINIITFDPLRDKVNTATLLGGTQGYVQGSAVGTGQIGDRAGVRISIGGFRASDFAPVNLPAPDAAIRQSPQVGSFNIDGRAIIAAGVEAYAETSMSDSRYAEKTFAGSFDTNFTRTNSQLVGLSADTAVGLLSFKAYRNGEDVTIAAQGLDGLPTWAREAVYVVQANDLLKIGTDHVVRAGFEYRNNALTSPGFVQGTIGYQVFAGSLMWNWQIAPNLSLTNAVRVDQLQLRYSGTTATGTGFTVADYNNAAFAVPSFNTGLVLNLTEKDTLRLMLARGVQLPSLVDFGLQIPFGAVGPIAVAGNPDVHPATIDSIELDYDRDIPALGGRSRVALFAQRNRDIISQPFSSPLTTGPTGLPVLLASNVGSSNAAGFELEIKGKTEWGLRWNFGYAFVATSDNTLLNRNGLVTSAIDYANSVPRNVVIAGIGYNHERWEMDLLGRWQSSYRDFQSTSSQLVLQPVEVRNYLSLNARLAYRLTDNFTVEAIAQQFNNSRLLQTAGPPVERRILGGITASF